MKRLFLLVLPLFLFFITFAVPAHAESGWIGNLGIAAGIELTGYAGDCGPLDPSVPQNQLKYQAGPCDPAPEGSTGGIKLNDGSRYGVKNGLLPQMGSVVALLYNNQISSREYIADILNNVGIPTVSSAFAQSTSAGAGYQALSPFLPFWKVFRNLAYSLYIIMFIVIGIMIMLRTKVNAQTIITIQSALPNLLITLILITFSYAIVGFMIDLMYFLIYFIVFLISTSGVIQDPNKIITRFMSYSAWSVIFEGRNSIISAVSLSLREVLYGLGSGALGLAGKAVGGLSAIGIGYLIVAIAFVIAMLKLMWALITSYIMLLVQTITAPVQILMNAMPGSKAFGTWLKKTASYLIPFPVVAAMFILAAILVGNPADKTILGRLGNDQALKDGNPFGVDQSAAIYQKNAIWMPPFTLTDSNIESTDILTIIGFVIFLMTPATVKMAQDWMQVKESPYTAEAFGNLGGGYAVPSKYIGGWIGTAREEARQRRLMEHQANLLGGSLSKTQQSQGSDLLKKQQGA